MAFDFNDLDPQEQARATANLSEKLAAARHEDYQERVKDLYPKLQTDEEFRKEILAAADPGEALYRAGIKAEADQYANEPLDSIMDIPVGQIPRR